eukprot:CAMPEP_0177324782 /NCGR_PEP_ID=MMETSP0368-20130122/17458_1 /TAXON_ID=447022 ORGANISM="Scrippsiella hangoei-like, Strain SHHI-4" /NCGR_SAMPLE_ID=MMETSP0368 /ASSEMBLY_ACC=CAM_ASM_000363 /LENGTH=44 /DNA_ID= /DNA_START= /DNA_END= /DNA_ORIENTATION=
MGQRQTHNQTAAMHPHASAPEDDGSGSLQTFDHWSHRSAMQLKG